MKNSKPSCPYQSRFLSLEGNTIEITRAAPDNQIKNSSRQRAINILNWIKKRCAKIGNTYLLYRHRELREPILKKMSSSNLINPFYTTSFDFKITSQPNFMKAILKLPRKDPEKGLFNDSGHEEFLLPLLQDLYPSEQINSEDFLLTCSKSRVNNYRLPILRFIGPQNIKHHRIELEKIIEETINVWFEESSKSKINATELSFSFFIHVLSRLLLGHPGPTKIYGDISSAVKCLMEYSGKRMWKQKISIIEKENYQEALETLRKAIAISITGEEKPILGAFVNTLRDEKKMSELQIKGMLLTVYFGGSETSASLLNYLLWQLGKNLDYQEEIYQELRQKEETLYDKSNYSKSIHWLFQESIRLFTPIYILSRKPATDLICNIKDKKGDVIYSEKIAKTDELICGLTFCARDPSQYENPDEFNPHRFQNASSSLTWLPFGDGQHSCPGQWLAKDTIYMFVAALVEKYYIYSSPTEDIGQKGHLTLKAKDDVWLILKPRR